jgi:hypothetical protein
MYGNGYNCNIYIFAEEIAKTVEKPKQMEAPICPRKAKFLFFICFFLRGSSQHFYLCTGSYFYCCASAVPLLI